MKSNSTDEIEPAATKRRDRGIAEEVDKLGRHKKWGTHFRFKRISQLVIDDNGRG